MKSNRWPLARVSIIIMVTVSLILFSVALVTAENKSINDRSRVIWESWNGAQDDIFMLRGLSSMNTNITNTPFADEYWFDINNRDQVAWALDEYGDYFIYLYSGGLTTAIPSPAPDNWYPVINDIGQVAWLGGPNLLYFYSRGAVTEIVDTFIDPDDPDINNRGEVVFSAYDGWDDEIFLYSGGRVTQVTDNTYWDGYPKINDMGQITWVGSPPPGDCEIFLYSWGRVTQVTNNDECDHYPHINRSGYIVWDGWDGSDWEIYMYNGARVTQVTNNMYYDWFANINDRGHLVWQGYDGTDYEIFTFRMGTTVTQLTHNTVDDFWPDINNSGHITWTSGIRPAPTTWEIYFYDGRTVRQVSRNAVTDNTCMKCHYWYW